MVVVDTSIIIDYTRQAPRQSDLARFVKTTAEEIAVAQVSIQELYRGKSTRQNAPRQLLEDTLAAMRILPYSYGIALRAGELMRDHSQPIEFADAAIAATAIEHGAGLLTLNLKDFAGIPELDLVKL